MRSLSVGTGTSKVEVSNISMKGVWLYARGKEYFLPYEDFPWFRDARISQIQHVKLLHGHHLQWADLDVDVDIDSLEHPDRYPLKYH